MSSNNSSNNRINVPEAKQGMEQFKMLIRQRGWRQPEERREGDLGKARRSRRCVSYERCGLCGNVAYTLGVYIVGKRCYFSRQWLGM